MFLTDSHFHLSLAISHAKVSVIGTKNTLAYYGALLEEIIVLPTNVSVADSAIQMEGNQP
jgi:hypothetical protein